ncbi:porphobilinogen synthase [Balneolaceae bacterium ANBcel3]|nr:porphobilinogen synthase [Balneolaceae bacterium ANBcel3]
MEASFPRARGRRNRSHEGRRILVAEHELKASDLIAPLFLTEGVNICEPIESIEGYNRLSVDLAVKKAEEWRALGIVSTLLFVKVPDSKKDNMGKEALNPDGLMQKAIRALKKAIPEMVVFSDVALDPYSTYGHDGIVDSDRILNDETNEVLAQMALSHAEAGVDYVAPSDMMDGRIQVIRDALEEHGYTDTGIMAYSAKYASGFYGPFRDALDSAPGFGDKKSYQMDYRNVKEAVREAQMDEREGADIIMVKPGMPYLDVVRAVAEKVSLPVAAYNVSGEYAMIKAAAEKGWLDEDAAMIESLMAFKRAGAGLIATYWAEKAAKFID